LRVGRELVPSGVGALVQTNLVRLAITKDLSPTITGLLEAGFYRSKYVSAVIDENKSRYFKVEPHVSWRVTPAWVVDAGYAYARQKYDAQPETAIARAVYLTLSYAWPKYAVSR
jgi:hypothetical protein